MENSPLDSVIIVNSPNLFVRFQGVYSTKNVVHQLLLDHETGNEQRSIIVKQRNRKYQTTGNCVHQFGCWNGKSLKMHM